MDKLTNATPTAAPATLDLGILKESLTMAQRNGRACIQCGSSDYPLKPAGILLDIKVVECDSHAWESSNAANPPTWLAAPCPAWCIEKHRAGDHPDDRQHVSVIYAVDLLTEDFEDFGAPAKPEFRPIALLADLMQGYREAEPRVCLSDSADKSTSRYLSLVETEEFAAHLTKLITQGRSIPTVQVPADGCAPWCVGHDTKNELCLSRTTPATDGEMFLTRSPSDGTTVTMQCRTDDLTVNEAEQVAHALLAQVALARSQSDPS